MTKKTFVIFPHQLFYTETSQYLQDAKCIKEVLIVEEPLFFYDEVWRPIRPHKIKLIYHVASMKAFYDYLKGDMASKRPDISVKYVKYVQAEKKLQKLKGFVSWSLHDMDLYKKYPQVHTAEISSPYFLMNEEDLAEYHRKTMHRKTQSNAALYDFVKKKLDVLAGIASTDTENRKPLPKKNKIVIPALEEMSGDTKTKKYVQDAIKYVKAHPAFQEHVGEVEDLKNVCIYPHTREEAFARLRGFIKERFENYGTYQDAISQDEPFLFHSIISAPLNIGILTPRDVLDEVMAVKDKVPMNSLEGFVRQLIGWREYCNYVYSYYYDEIVDADHFDATNEDISSWYTATTGVEPLDNEIQKAKKYAFSHHIVRLMIFLNMFVLTETKINVIYKWFMEVVSIDAYDWVMRSNIAMMSHYWTKGMRKPYISGANYVLKMSDYKKGEWCNVWTERFHTFLKKKKDKLVGSASIYLRNIPRE